MGSKKKKEIEKKEAKNPFQKQIYKDIGSHGPC